MKKKILEPIQQNIVYYISCQRGIRKKAKDFQDDFLTAPFGCWGGVVSDPKEKEIGCSSRVLPISFSFFYLSFYSCKHLSKTR